MSSYGIYIWPCYLLVLILFIWHVFAVMVERRKIFKQLAVQHLPKSMKTC